LFVEVVVVVLQEAMTDSQLPDFLVFGYNIDRMLTSLKVEFETRVPQRVSELRVSVSVVANWLLLPKKHRKLHRVKRYSMTPWTECYLSQGFTHVFHLIVGV
jgi:hypothetical protein